MFKILSQAEFDKLKKQANSFSAIVTAIISNNKDAKEEDITGQTVIDALNTGDTNLQSQLDAANETITKLNSEIKTLNEQVKTLSKEPAVEPAKPKSNAEPEAEPQSLTDFADKNAGDIKAITDRMKSEGLL